ncbi:helix-turn-helix domain-containing protein [Zhongshania sp. BJYM1]|uniref:helix-turn-helix domain-containing protein n=1 Tax=Zhongshania aquatica TaxID=2965069 RepID=UPI0022B38A2D|nr:helix-turn-helix domain-containing protein [Marortus sp. BJYM1]
MNDVNYFTTRNIIPSNRLDAWNNLVGERLGNCVIDARKEFVASFTSRSFGTSSLSIVEGDAATLSTSITANSKSTNKFRFLLVHTKKCRAKYTFYRNSNIVDDDSFVLVDLTKPFSCDIPTDNKYISMICIREEDMFTCSSLLEQAVGRKINLQVGSGNVLKCLVERIWHGDDISPERGGRLLLDMVDLALYDAVKSSKEDINNRTRFSFDVISYIKNNLNDPYLSTSSIANHCGVSQRCIQLVFSDMRTTPTQFIRTLRLNAIASTLAISNQSISDIIYGIGYSDYSQFCRSFKEKFGVSASQYRRQLRR